jgi:hypothetical protein
MLTGAVLVLVPHWGHAGGVYVGCLPVTGPVYHRVQFSSILSLLLFARKGKKQKREKWPETFPKADAPQWLCHPMPGLPQLLGAIKSCFKGQSLGFMCTMCVGSYLVG